MIKSNNQLVLGQINIAAGSDQSCSKIILVLLLMDAALPINGGEDSCYANTTRIETHKYRSGTILHLATWRFGNQVAGSELGR